MIERLTRVPLERTGMEITGVGLGAWAICGDDRDSIAAIWHAVKSGISRGGLDAGVP